MRAVDIIPGIVVYKDVLKDSNKMVDIIKKTENDTDGMFVLEPNQSIYQNIYTFTGKKKQDLDPKPRNGFHIIKTWVPWYDFGIKSQFSFAKDLNNDDEDLNKQIEIQKELVEAQFNCYYDYVNKWKDKISWPSYATNFTMYGGPFVDADGSKNQMSFSSLEILKHHPHPEKQYAIPWHTDSWNHFENAPGSKFVITATVYLNDDYEGGEIQFINYEEKKLITYKPQAGDITFFPASKPFWHSALPVKSGYKYFTRVLITVEFEGTKEWWEERKKYDNETWEKMEFERINREENEAKHGFYIVIEGDESYKNMGIKHEIIFVKKENNIYIDGKNI